MAGHLAKDSVGLADLASSVASLHGNRGEFGQRNGPVDGRGCPLGSLTKIDMALVVPSGNRCLEPGLLASVGLLLHRCSLQARPLGSASGKSP